MAFKDYSIGVNLFGHDNVSGALKKMGDNAKKTETTMHKVGKGMARAFDVAAVAAAGLALKIGKDSIKAASDYNETVSKTRAIFGDAADAILKFSETSATKLGQSKTQALDAAGTFALFGKTAGLTGKDLTDFSTGFVKMSADLSSFYNTSPEDAITAIGAAMRGEMEPIRRYNVLINESLLKEKAVSMGLVKSNVDVIKAASAKASLIKAQQKLNKVNASGKSTDTDRKLAVMGLDIAKKKLAATLKGKMGELTMEQKILATRALIAEQTKVATGGIGDFAKTSEGAANSQRILAAQVEDMKIAIGDKLLPTYQKFLRGIIKFIDSPQGKKFLDDFVKGFQSAVETAAALLPDIVTGLKNISTAASTMNIDFTKIMDPKLMAAGVAFKYTPGPLPMKALVALAAYYAAMSPSEKVPSGGAAKILLPNMKAPDTSSWAPGTWMPNIDALGTNTQTIPGLSYSKHAKGGIVTRPHLGLVGEAGPEAIIPLSKAGRYGFGGNIYITVEGSVISERDLVFKLRNELGQLMRRQSVGTAAFGI